MPKTNDIVQDVYSLIDEDSFEEAEEQLEYMTTGELTSLFNYLTTVCPNNRLMKVVEEEISARTISMMPDEYNPGDEYHFFE